MEFSSKVFFPLKNTDSSNPNFSWKVPNFDAALIRNGFDIHCILWVEKNSLRSGSIPLGKELELFVVFQGSHLCFAYQTVVEMMQALILPWCRAKSDYKCCETEC